MSIKEYELDHLLSSASCSPIQEYKLTPFPVRPDSNLASNKPTPATKHPRISTNLSHNPSIAYPEDSPPSQNPMYLKTPAMTSVRPSPPAQYYSPGLRGRFQIDAHRPVPPPQEKYEPIDYEFDDAKYAARTEAVLRAGKLERTLPPEFPPSVSGPLVWSGGDFSEDDYVVHLSERCQAEVKRALRYFRCKSIHPHPSPFKSCKL